MDPGADISVVLDALTRAACQDTKILKPAEEQLQQWETQPGFYSTLLKIFISQAVDTNVRWLAVLYFKNGVERYWRRLAPNALCEEEKIFLKQQLISDFSEPVNQIATQLAVLIGKVARLDCPREWQELIPTLLEVVKCNIPLVQQRGLLTLHHVVKALASKRLAPDRKMFEELTMSLFSFILLLWNNYTESFFHALQIQDRESVLTVMDHSILALKVLRRLVVFGFKKPQDHQEAMSLITLVYERSELFLKSKDQMLVLARELLPKREKILTLLTKIILDFQEYHSEAFVEFIQPSLEFTVRFNFTPEGQDLLHERFQVNTLNIMRALIRCETYRPAKSVEETKNPLTIQAYKVKMEFFTRETLSEIGRRLVLQYFLLSQEDLALWDADPEDFVGEEGGDSWKYSLRPCTENLYLTLMKEFRASLSPVILQLMEEHQGSVDVNDIGAILRKDAVLNAAGLASFDLFDDVDFDTWLTSSLMRELQNDHTNYRIIRRRVIWLVGCWVGVKLSSDLRPLLYKTLIPFLLRGQDMVVRIETAMTIQSAVDDFDFKIEQFSPYLESCFDALFSLLLDVNECEMKMQILHVMSFIIERMKTEVRPFAGSLIRYLPSLWKDSEEHNMLRCAILTTLTHLVWGLGDVSTTMYEFLLPVIKFSTDITNEPHIYLCEDALDLWLATLQSSPLITKELLQLYKNIPPLLELGGDTLRSSIKIIESYILLGHAEFLKTYSASLVSSLASLLTDLRSEGVVMIYKLVELVFMIFPEQGPRIFYAMLPDVMKSIIEKQECPMEVSIKITLISRIILQNQTFFFEIIDGLSQQWNTPSAEILGTFMDSCFDKMDSIIQPERRKLICLAFLSLLSSTNIVILERFFGIINITVETLHDVCRSDSDGIEQDSLLFTYNTESITDELETQHDKRNQELSKQDPVHALSLKAYTATQLNSCRHEVGDPAFDKLMDTVDCEIAQQLQQFLT